MACLPLNIRTKTYSIVFKFLGPIWCFNLGMSPVSTAIAFLELVANVFITASTFTYITIITEIMIKVYMQITDLYVLLRIYA